MTGGKSKLVWLLTLSLDMGGLMVVRLEVTTALHRVESLERARRLIAHGVRAMRNHAAIAHVHLGVIPRGARAVQGNISRQHGAARNSFAV